MRIVFMGTSPFAVPTLERLLADTSHQILGVVTQPDRPHGRGGGLAPSPVKRAALAAALTIFQPEKVRSKEFVGTIREITPDVLVVAAFGQIIPQRMLDIPAYGGINVHGSLLPRWRGAAPMQYALMAGDRETGVTTIQMSAGLDSGDILLSASLPLSDEDTLGSIESSLADLGAALLPETLARLEHGDCPRTVQDEALVTLAPSLPPNIGEIDWTRPARDLHNLVRGVTPRPGAYCFWRGKRLKVLQTAFDSDGGDSAQAGVVQTVDSQGITIGTARGVLRLIRVQPESKSAMPADAWARGARVTPGDTFSLERQDMSEEQVDAGAGGTVSAGNSLQN